MRRTFGVLLLSGFVLSSFLVRLHGQPPDQKKLAFEVASIKPNTSGETGIGAPGDGAVNGRYRVTNTTVRDLMRQAFQRWRDDEIIGGPSWLDTERWDIVAKADLPTSSIMPRVRTLLSDRFKLVTHHETRERPIFALVVARNDGRLGPNLRASDCVTGLKPDGTRCGLRIGVGTFVGSSVAMRTLVDGLLTSAVQRTVVDRTGLSGNYDVDLHWTPENIPERAAGTSHDQPVTVNGASVDPNGPSLFTALQEQLGLKLESTKGPIDVLVIDHVERPRPD